MIPNNNLSVLPFYESVEEQDFRKSYAFDVKHPLITSRFKIPPFQIRRDHVANNITEAKLVNLTSVSELNILSDFQSAGLSVKEFISDGYDLIINPSKLIFPNIVMDLGLYYLKLSDGVNTWFSDIFAVMPETDSYLKLEYWDSENLYYTGGHIDYSNAFKFYVFLQAEIGKPEYPFEEEVQERDGYHFIEKQISEKTYKFKFLAPEYLCDALRVVRMHDYIQIWDNGKKYTVENIIFDPKWQKQGNLAVMEVEFQCDTVVKKIGRGLVSTNEGQFNNDFNNDFNN